MTPTHSAVAAIRNDDIHKWVVATLGLNPGVGPIAALTASIDALVMEHVQGTFPPPEGLPDHTGWCCGKPDHLRRGCSSARHKSRFPHCNNSFHWAKDCHSQKLEDILNSKRGTPQPHH